MDWMEMDPPTGSERIKPNPTILLGKTLPCCHGSFCGSVRDPSDDGNFALLVARHSGRWHGEALSCLVAAKI